MGSAPLQNRLRGGLVKIYRGKSRDGYKKRGKDAVLVKTADFFFTTSYHKSTVF